jgi:hypothetical protein
MSLVMKILSLVITMLLVMIMTLPSELVKTLTL